MQRIYLSTYTGKHCAATHPSALLAADCSPRYIVAIRIICFQIGLCVWQTRLNHYNARNGFHITVLVNTFVRRNDD
jgi:hypothetical protein